MTKSYKVGDRIRMTANDYGLTVGRIYEVRCVECEGYTGFQPVCVDNDLGHSTWPSCRTFELVVDEPPSIPDAAPEYLVKTTQRVCLTTSTDRQVFSLSDDGEGDFEFCGSRLLMIDADDIGPLHALLGALLAHRSASSAA